MNGGKALPNIVAVSFTKRKPLVSRALYNYTLCLVLVCATLDFAIRKPIASYMLLLFLTVSQAQSSIPVQNHWTETKPICSRKQPMIFNEKVRFTQVEFRREKKEGRMVAEPVPFYINITKIDGFGDGVLRLDSGDVIYVEQDADQINAIIEAKLEEQEAYSKMLREIDRVGIEPTEGEVE